ncbi:MAG: hypothetical protein JXR96_20870 [Deltaproteobacteria bacterium]|nr:hypothetical protein [Deltaproteobacteria bacterium]
MKRCLAMAVAGALALSGCGSGDGQDVGEYAVRAHVTLTDGQEFDFAERCVVSSMDFEEKTYWGFEAKDMQRVFGLVFTWEESELGGPESFDLADSGLDVMIVRPHPTEPGTIRMSGAQAGSVTFSQVGYTPGDRLEGSFDGLRLDRDEPDDTVHIAVDDGSFCCRVAEEGS